MRYTRFVILLHVLLSSSVLAIPSAVEAGGGNTSFYRCPGIGSTQHSLPFLGFLVAEQVTDQLGDSIIALTLVVTGKRSLDAEEEAQTFRLTDLASEILQSIPHKTLSALSRGQIQRLITAPNPFPRGSWIGLCFTSQGQQLFLTEGKVLITTLGWLSSAVRAPVPIVRPQTDSIRELLKTLRPGPSVFRIGRVSGIVVPAGDLLP